MSSPMVLAANSSVTLAGTFLQLVVCVKYRYAGERKALSPQGHTTIDPRHQDT